MGTSGRSEKSEKSELKRELESRLAVELDAVERAHRSTREAATHEEAKPENDKDTRALEQSYLARGQALRVEDLRAAVADVGAMPLRDFTGDDPIALGALVAAEEDGASGGATVVRFFIAAHGGGTRLTGEVQVVTPRSPLGQALLGKREGDDCEVRLAGRTRVLSIVRVR
jgi:transcription elongation GreA/GreB family factor